MAEGTKVATLSPVMPQLAMCWGLLTVLLQLAMCWGLLIVLLQLAMCWGRLKDHVKQAHQMSFWCRIILCRAARESICLQPSMFE